MKTSKEKGSELEELIVAYFKDIYPKCRVTVASGARSEVADIANIPFYIEAKNRSTQDFTIKNKVWKKLCSQIPIGSQKVPLYILGNENKELLVILDIKDFMRILKENNAKKN
jgi:hypothetical protein